MRLNSYYFRIFVSNNKNYFYDFKSFKVVVVDSYFN
jgi:hypothetical protein